MTTLIMFYGMSFILGFAGNTLIIAMSQMQANPLVFVGVGLMYFGLFAKISAAPFHWWAPDAYEGSEAWTLGFASVVPKVAAGLVTLKLTIMLFGEIPMLAELLMVAAIASMALGSFAALTQKDLRRLMAYSGIVNMGYFLVATAMMALGGPKAADAFYVAIFFLAAYSIPSLGLFLVLSHEGPKISDLNGLSQRKPFAAWAIVVFSVSLIGIPPLMGFFAKFNLYIVIVQANQIALVIAATILTVVSAFYYVRIIRAAFFEVPQEALEVDAQAVTTLENADEDPDEELILAAAEGESLGQFAQLEDETDSEGAGEPDPNKLPEADHAADYYDADERAAYSVSAYLAIGILLALTAALGILYGPIMKLLTHA
jgi:NADH-quinone oxidoreductase subunit N